MTVTKSNLSAWNGGKTNSPFNWKYKGISPVWVFTAKDGEEYATKTKKTALAVYDWQEKYWDGKGMLEDRYNSAWWNKEPGAELEVDFQ